MTADKAAGKKEPAVIEGVAPIAHSQVLQFLKFSAFRLGTSAPYIASLYDAEPFVIQSTLNETVRQNFSTGANYIWRQILSGIPGGKSIFGIDSSNIPTFNSLF